MIFGGGTARTCPACGATARACPACGGTARACPACGGAERICAACGAWAAARGGTALLAATARGTGFAAGGLAAPGACCEFAAGCFGRSRSAESGWPAGRGDAGRKRGAARSLPSGGVLESVTADYPLRSNASTMQMSPFPHRMVAHSCAPAQSNTKRILAVDCRPVRSKYGERVIWRYSAYRLNTRLALVPPKPNEFDSATLTGRLRARCGTRSIAVATDGLSRL